MESGLMVLLLQLVGLMVVLGILVFVMVLTGYLLVIWYRHKDREEQSLQTVCLQIAVPRDNEIKIDAMEQVIASLYSIKKGPKGPFGWLTFLQVQPHISL